MKELIEFYNSDVNAPDLTSDGVKLRNKFFASYYDPAILYGTLLRYVLLVLPVVFGVPLYYYNKIKNKSLKYVIGKSKNFNKYLFKIKIKVSIIPVIILYVVFGAYTIASYVLTHFKIRAGANFDNHFLPTNVFSFLNGSFSGYLILLFLSSGLYIFWTTMLLLTITDYGYRYIYVIISYILLSYIVNDFIMMHVSRSLSLSGSLSWISGRESNITTIISYIYMLFVYLFLKFTRRKEF
ncbi:hypothetical protein [Gemella cuniculi]|uniref:hypothetical protein n=1 Tax=Gemella cuniculi TaxID=150240 RepID=UPI000415D8B2|nr:hypothetical protein [Gemella cuniculi]